MVAGYLVIITFLGLGGGILIFSKYRRLWHADEQLVTNLELRRSER
jgi:hypothetical protein